MLAAMYLEDRIEPKRAAELLKDLATHRKQMTWEDAYLDALVARNEGAPSVENKINALTQGLGPNDTRRARVAAAFPQEASA